MTLDYSRIAVVGATGAVGREVLSILADRGVDAARVVALASARSAGTRLAYGGATVEIAEVTASAFDGVDLALFCATSAVSKEFVSAALERGATVIDNSSAFRMDPGVPLVIPEVNGALLRNGARLIANPNCSTIILLVALEPLRRAFGVERVVVSTYQAVSGAGAAAMDELRDQASAALEGTTSQPRVFAEPCAFNVFSHNSAVDPATGLNGEEQKIIDEARKIWETPGLSVSPTCVRVPVLRAHTESITVTLSRPASEAEVRAALEDAAGIDVIDSRETNSFPTPLKATGKDDVFVGRIRRDPGAPADRDGRSRGFSLLVCADQLRKGAALNAVQIADLVRAGVAGRPAVGAAAR